MWQHWKKAKSVTKLQRSKCDKTQEFQNVIKQKMWQTEEEKKCDKTF